MDILNQYYLEEISKPYLDIVLKWRNSERIKNAMYSDHEITMDEHLSWYESVLNDHSVIVKLLFYNDFPIGLVSFSDINYANQRCFWGFYIGEENVPKHSGKVLGYLSLDFIFNLEKINKVCAEVIATNPKSLSYHKQLGFVEEGYFKDHIYKKSQFLNVTRLAIFKDNWRRTRKDIVNIILGG